MSKGIRVAAVALTLVVAACGDTPVAPQTDSRTTSANGTLARYLSGAPRVAGFASKSIGPEGGTLSLAGFEMVVPPGAVSQPTTFAIRLPVDEPMSAYVWASFEPAGVRFEKPLTLKLPYVGTSSAGGIPNVVWFDGTLWVTTTTTSTNDGRIQTQTTQLTDYGTQETDPSKGIEPVGG